MTATTAQRTASAGIVPSRSRNAPARSHPVLILVLIGLGALLTVGLWWQNTPSVNGLGDWLTNAGRITGLLAGYGVVVLVALMARIPPVERGIGADRLARWHAMGGRYVVSLVVTHALLITWGYAVTAHTSLTGQAWTLLMSYPDVLAASVAGLLLVGVGLVSARAARARLRYETWYYLHFYTYLAIALAFSHQFADGAEFVNNRTARVVWSTLYLVVAAAILWFRFITPARQAARHRLRVHAVRKEAPGVVSVVIRGRHVDELKAEPGQFFRWRFLNRELWWVSAPYSLSAPPKDNHLRITVKALGEHSREMARLRRGTRVIAEGPYGALTEARRTQRRVLLIAAGVGITPLRALFETLPARPGELTLLYRASDDRDVVFRRELRELAAKRRANLHIVTGRRAELGWDPLAADALVRNIAHLERHDVYLCGPPGMTDAVTKALRFAGVPRRRIHHESFEF